MNTTLAGMLRDSTWGRVLTAAQLERVTAERAERQVSAGGYVARMDQSVLHWIGVIEGLLKMSVTTPDRISTLTGINGGGWFGEGSVMKREPRRYDVVALRASRVVMVPHATFEWLRGSSIPFCHDLHQLMNARLSLFIGMLEYDRLLGSDARVARCLATSFNIDLHPSPRPFIDLRQNEIALPSGLSRQRVNAALRTLQTNGLLRIEPRGITVLDGLRGFAGHC